MGQKRMKTAADEAGASLDQRYGVLVAECRKYRAQYERAEVAFFLFLMRVEREEEEVWRGGGCANFDQFLRSNDLAEVYRYRAFVAGANRIGVESDEILSRGVAYVIGVGELRPDKITAKVVKNLEEAANAFQAVYGTAPSEQTVKDWILKETHTPRESEIVRRASELQRLRALVKKLEAERDAALARVRELEQRYEKKKKSA